MNEGYWGAIRSLLSPLKGRRCTVGQAGGHFIVIRTYTFEQGLRCLYLDFSLFMYQVP